MAVMWDHRTCSQLASINGGFELSSTLFQTWSWPCLHFLYYFLPIIQQESSPYSEPENGRMCASDFVHAPDVGFWWHWIVHIRAAVNFGWASSKAGVLESLGRLVEGCGNGPNLRLIWLTWTILQGSPLDPRRGCLCWLPLSTKLSPVKARGPSLLHCS